MPPGDTHGCGAGRRDGATALGGNGSNRGPLTALTRAATVLALFGGNLFFLVFLIPGAFLAMASLYRTQPSN